MDDIIAVRLVESYKNIDEDQVLYIEWDNFVAHEDVPEGEKPIAVVKVTDGQPMYVTNTLMDEINDRTI